MKPDRAGEHDRIGPYQLLKAIGAGGSARIDLARIERAYNFQRHVVIKRPLEHLRDDAKAAASLRREARIGARLRHPNLVAILDADVHDGYDYLVLEYIHGGSLRALMQAEAPSRVCAVSTNVALAIVGDIARGLHAAHELTDEEGAPLGLVHRDVSPGNVLVGLDGSVKLADFGIAKETRVQTLSGSMHGTVTYMAPEQCRGHAIDRRADVFSLGVIFYELVTGTRLFWADNDVASLHKVLSGNVPRPRKLRPSISPALEEIVMTAVAHEQERRFATARDLADAIELCARENGEILGARWIARWASEILGPHAAPWIAAQTTPGIHDDLESERSLVELIESLAGEDPPDPTFGPTAPFSDEIDTKPRREAHAPARANKLAIAVVATGLVGGAAITAVVMMRDDAPAPAASAPAPAPAPAPESQPAGETDEPATEPTAEIVPVSENELASEPEPRHRRHKRTPPKRDKEQEQEKEREEKEREEKEREEKEREEKEREREKDRAKAEPPDATASPAAAGSSSVADESNAPPAGSGSQKRTKVEWNPTMLLPTDKK